MAQKKDTQAITFRAPTSVIRQLDELCSLMNMKRSQFFINAVTSEYDRLHGNPKALELMNQLRQVSESLRQMAGR